MVETRISKINSNKRRQFIVGFIPVCRSQNALTRKLPEQYLSSYLSTALHRNLTLGTQRMVTHECLTQDCTDVTPYPRVHATLVTWTRRYGVVRGLENAEILCKV